MSARFIVGDSLTVLRSLPDASVDLVLTSPPFLALRSYLPTDHPDKGLEVGTEAGPGEFVDTLVSVIEECRRVLAPHGSLVFELGDTYCGARGYGTEGTDLVYGERHDVKIAENRALRRFKKAGDTWPLDKCLALVPESLRWTLAYGLNPFTGRTTEPWRIRNVIRWCRPNPPVGALSDKFRPATSDLLIACVGRSRYFDLDAVRTEPKTSGNGSLSGYEPGGQPARMTLRQTNAGGAPPLDWWEISTEPYKDSHYATWPSALLTKPILAMCPQRVCRTCGEPSRRITERTPEYAAARESIGDFNTRDNGQGTSGSRSTLSKAAGRDITSAENVTVGWTDCGHDKWRSGVVLDPFAGSGTTLAVATGHGRSAIGIDLDERNAELAMQRVGMWLTVEHYAEEVPA